MHRAIRLLNFDFNWSMCELPTGEFRHCASAPDDWAFIDPVEYVDWHEQRGNNSILCQAYTQPGTALYPSRFGQNAPGPGRELCLRVAEETTRRGLSFWSYFSVGSESMLSTSRPQWTIAGSREVTGWLSFFAPESPWTDLLCNRIAEFLGMCPQTDWLLLDWFGYGSYTDAWPRVDPRAWFVRANFPRICGRPAPETPEDVTDEEDLLYKRTVLAEQFVRIRDTVRQANPRTKIMFNVPYHRPADPRWVDHPMVLESDGLFSEATTPGVMDWLLEIRRPEQRLMTTLAGMYHDEALCDPSSWRTWYDKGCDFFAYVWGVPPTLRLHADFEPKVAQVAEAFAKMAERERPR